MSALLSISLFLGCDRQAPPASAGSAVSATDWCNEHGVPESVCTRCNPALIAHFKERNDWCAGHGLPESQCVLCNPEVKEKWLALRPASVGGSAPANTGIRVEPVARAIDAPNDPLCQVDQLRIRFLDPSIARKAGIQSEPAAIRRISASVECPGEVQFDQTRLAHLTPRVHGVITEVRAEIGLSVATGDVLAIIDSPALGQAKNRFIELREKHRLAEDDFNRLDAILTGTKQMLDAAAAEASGEEVSGEEVFRRVADVRVGEYKSRFLKAFAARSLARATLDRETRLREQKVSSDQAFETARSALLAAEADLAATREEIAFAAERDRLAAEKAVRIARSAMDAAERELHILGLSNEEVAALGSGPDEGLSRYELRSPVNGQVVQRHAVVGESVTEQDGVFTIADVSSMWVVLDLAERDLIELRVGLPVLLTVDGLPGHSFAGRLSWIGSQVDERTRTVKARADLTSSVELLRANMYGTARIVLHDDDAVLAVPESAVQSDGCCRLVFLREADDLYTPRKVVLGSRSGGYVEVHEGLAAGDHVVTTGSFLMKTEILKSNLGAGCCEVQPGR